MKFTMHSSKFINNVPKDEMCLEKNQCQIFRLTMVKMNSKGNKKFIM